MRHARSPARVLGPLLLAAALAACAESDRGGRDYGGRDYGGGYGLGGILGDILGGGRGGYGGGLFGADRVAFRCDDDRRFTVALDRDGRYATVNTEDRSYDLRAEDDRGRSRSYRSDNGDVQLDLDRDQAYLRIKDGRDYKNCEAR
jgi:hypothetical protein